MEDTNWVTALDVFDKRIYGVLESINNGMGTIKLDNGDYIDCYKAGIEYIPAPWDIGTSVKVINQHAKSYGFIGEVKRRNYDRHADQWVYGLGKLGHVQYDDLQIIKQPSFVTKFKQGDKVRVIKESSDSWNMIGTVRRSNCTVINHYDIQLEDTTSLTLRYNEIEPLIKTKSNKENTMSKAKDQLNANKDAAILAGKLVAGKAINTKLVKLLKPKLPMMIRGYADSPFASLVAANIVGIAIKHYAPTNRRANEVADLMLEAAALEALQSFNIEDLIEELLKGVKLPKEDKTTEDDN